MILTQLMLCLSCQIWRRAKKSDEKLANEIWSYNPNPSILLMDTFRIPGYCNIGILSIIDSVDTKTNSEWQNGRFVLV